MHVLQFTKVRPASVSKSMVEISKVFVDYQNRCVLQLDLRLVPRLPALIWQSSNRKRSPSEELLQFMLTPSKPHNPELGSTIADTSIEKELFLPFFYDEESCHDNTVDARTQYWLADSS